MSTVLAHPPPVVSPPPRGLWGEAWRRLQANRAAVAGLLFLFAVVNGCLALPYLIPFSPTEQNLDLGASAPLALIVGRHDPLTEAPPRQLPLSRLVDDIAAQRSLRQLDAAVASAVEEALTTALTPVVTLLKPEQKPAELARYLVSSTGRLTQEALQDLREQARDLTAAERGTVLDSLRSAEGILKAALTRLTLPLQRGLQRGEAVQIVVPGEITVRYVPLGRLHWFGTDETGRDLLARLAAGGRISLAVGAAATLVSVLVGVFYGAISGLAGGRLDALMMRGVDILYALPFTLLVILLMTLFPRSLLLIFVAIGAVEWLTMARMVRGQVLTLKRQGFVEAARLLGRPWAHILWRHLVPNLLGTVIVYASLTVPAVILLESILSFLGLGVQPPAASWGSLIHDGALKGDVYPWLLIAPALIFSLTLLAFNFVGDGLRDALDPRLSHD